jgi:hypothetical protein
MMGCERNVRIQKHRDDRATIRAYINKCQELRSALFKDVKFSVLDPSVCNTQCLLTRPSIPYDVEVYSETEIKLNQMYINSWSVWSL